ncbi:2,3-diaminopropionate biosynthesis protein SbnA [Streptomyces sp. NPDC016566]|uniref:2,3-diaminopropionate biosynthesis protein SbnA n=1 Tax=Streptomyces sp. NPDC016566 TaxID=3364967 RepID=UPI0037011DA5
MNSAVCNQAYDAGPAQPFLTLPGFCPGFSTTLKLEALNPAGSIKLKTAREMVASARQEGRLRAGAPLIESTSGNLGIALAMVCTAHGHPLTLVTDPNTQAQNIRHMRALGAKVVVVTRRDDNGGYLRSRIEFIENHLPAHPDTVWLNQYRDPAGARAHRRDTMGEILDGFGVPDWLFVGAGSTGTLMGCLTAVRERRLPTRLVAVDAEGSVTFGGRGAPRHLPGLGTSRRPELFVDDGSFVKIRVAEADTVRACRRVARGYGLLPGASTGTALHAVTELHRLIKGGARVLVIAPDLGERYLDTVYDDDWVIRTFGPAVLASPERWTHHAAQDRPAAPALPVSPQTGTNHA